MKIDLFRVMHDGNMFYLKTSLICLQFDWLMFEWKEFQTEKTRPIRCSSASLRILVVTGRITVSENKKAQMSTGKRKYNLLPGFKHAFMPESHAT